MPKFSFGNRISLSDDFLLLMIIPSEVFVLEKKTYKLEDEVGNKSNMPAVQLDRMIVESVFLFDY